MRFLSAGTTHVGLKRKHNEDALLDARERGLWVVADGMGGHEAGDVAAKLVVESLQSLPAKATVEELLEEAKSVLVSTNDALVAMAHQGGGRGKRWMPNPARGACRG